MRPDAQSRSPSTEMVRTIEVAQYDVAWTAAFNQEAAALSRVFGDSLVAIHHTYREHVDSRAPRKTNHRYSRCSERNPDNRPV